MSLVSYKSRMEKDFMMISARYTKLFNSLNKALRIRIFELDKPTTNFVNKDIESIANRVKLLSATTATHQLESLEQIQVIASSNTKYNALKAIEAMQQFIANSTEQKYLVSRILDNNSLGSKTKCMIPVVITETEGISNKQKQWNYFMPQSEKKNLTSKINLNVQSYIFSSTSNMSWTVMPIDEKNKVSDELNRIIEKSPASDRVKKQISKLFETSNWQKLSKI